MNLKNTDGYADRKGTERLPLFYELRQKPKRWNSERRSLENDRPIGNAFEESLQTQG
jgi:hypothetical protein